MIGTYKKGISLAKVTLQTWYIKLYKITKNNSKYTWDEMQNLKSCYSMKCSE